MGNRRMIARDVIGLDEFISLPHSAQALYLHLTIEADNLGLVGSTKRVLRISGCAEDDMTALIENGFVHRFDSGVIVLLHWRVANTVKDDRKNTNFEAEYAQLQIDENSVYTLVSIPSDSILEASGTGLETSGTELVPKVTQRNLTKKKRREPNVVEGKGGRGRGNATSGGYSPRSSTHSSKRCSIPTTSIGASRCI